MATNKLFEAAAEILAGTKGKNAEPMHKMPAEVVDLGGPTPQNAKPDDDSHKIDAAKSAKKAVAPTTKPSDASAKMEEAEVENAEVVAEEETQDEANTLDVSSDINALFADDNTISEEFKAKAATIFEARVLDRVNQIHEEIESRYASMLEESVEAIKNDLTEKVNDYLSYVVEQWISDNEIAIESGLRAELTEEFIAGLRNLFAEHYIDVPSEKVDLVEELAGKVEELETKLNEEIQSGIEYKKALVEATKNEVVREVCEGLTDTQVEKIKSLAESVDFSTEEEYKSKLETIRENYFPSGVKVADETQLHEKVEDNNEGVRVTDPFVASVMNAISKTKI
jgi:hypothetical protein